MGSVRDAGEAEEEPVLTYPSPGVGAIDPGPFYHSTGRDGNVENQDQSGQHAAEEAKGQEQQQKREHDTAHLASQQPVSPQQHVSPSANLEELQLAAQLGQGLAASAILPATDPNMNVEDTTNLRTLMPRPQREPDHLHHHHTSYVQGPASADATDQHRMPVPIDHHYSMNDGIPPRKRSKVSRACDTCRRKKIKCDAQTDSGETPCSSCTRAKEPCLFSRVPQKRGPSKGYIKELADRIHSIENKLESDGNLSQDDIDKLFVTDRSRQSNGLENSTRKRPFSSISAGDFATPHNIRQAPWNSEPRSSQPGPGVAEAASHEYMNSSLAPQPEPIPVEETAAKEPIEIDDAATPDEEEVTSVDDQAYDFFIKSIQPLCPILPNDKDRLQSLLARSSPAVRAAFNLTLPSVGQPSGDVKTASSILHEWEGSDAPHNRATDVVHAQTLLMLIIDADWREASTLPFLLGRGVALANEMKLWKIPSAEAMSEHDSDEQLCARLWWSLVLIDRWHAAGTGHPSHIPDRSAVLPAGLKDVIGEVSFHLLRLSKLLNRISFVISSLQPGETSADPSMAAILTDYIDDWRGDLPAHIDAAAYPMVHLAYWHCRLLVALLTPGATPKEIFWPTKELSHLLSESAEVKGPFIHHFVSLAAMALGELVRNEAMHEEITAIIRDIIEKPSGGHWEAVREKLAEWLRPMSSSGPDAASQGLQHLADLATAHEGGDDALVG